MTASRHVKYGICFTIAAIGAALAFGGEVVFGGVLALGGAVGAYLLAQPTKK